MDADNEEKKDGVKIGSCEAELEKDAVKAHVDHLLHQIRSPPPSISSVPAGKTEMATQTPLVYVLRERPVYVHSLHPDPKVDGAPSEEDLQEFAYCLYQEHLHTKPSGWKVLV